MRVQTEMELRMFRQNEFMYHKMREAALNNQPMQVMAEPSNEPAPALFHKKQWGPAWWGRGAVAGEWENILEWWASGETLDEEVRVTLNLVAVGGYCSVFLSVILVYFNSVQLNLTLSQPRPAQPNSPYKCLFGL